MAAIPLKQILKARTIEGEIYDRLEGDRVHLGGQAVTVLRGELV